MRDFSEFGEYLSEEGHQFLSKWGIKLLGLYEGRMEPSRPNERQFVDAFKSGKCPEGTSEVIWFNIIAINQLIEKCASLESHLENEKLRIKGLVARINNQESEIEKRVGPLNVEVDKLKDNLKTCWAKIDRYEKELNITKPQPVLDSRKICPICQGTGAMGNCSRCDGNGYI